MKDPKDMTREELADVVETCALSMLLDGRQWSVQELNEAAARLRDSIDRPKVEVVVGDYISWKVRLNGHEWWHDDEEYAEAHARFLRIALGMEGGA